MKYSELDEIYKGQVLQGPYEEVTVCDPPVAGAFLQKHIFYQLFFLFLLGSVFGCYMEQIQYYILKGIWECRAGVIWGPFSEVYGLGAVLMYLLSRLLKDKSPLTIFCTATVCGSAFEYIARLFQELTFGSITWDYSRQPLNIGGRTSLKYGIYWGLLGLILIKWIFPFLDKNLVLIRGKAAFLLTWLLIVFMAVDLIASTIAVSRWNERIQGISSENNLEQYIDEHYDNEKMETRFPHMKFIDISKKIM